MVQLLKFKNGYVISSHTFNGCDYISMLGLKLNHVSRSGPRNGLVNMAIINIIHINSDDLVQDCNNCNKSFISVYMFHAELFERPANVHFHYHPVGKYHWINFRKASIWWESVGLMSNQWRTYGSCYVPWWHHQMKKMSVLLALCEGNSLVTCEFPSQKPVTRTYDDSLIWDLTNGWASNRDPGDLSCHYTHYYVTVMWNSEANINKWYGYN